MSLFIHAKVEDDRLNGLGVHKEHTHTHILVFKSKWVFVTHSGNGLPTFLKDFELKLLLN